MNEPFLYEDEFELRLLERRVEYLKAKKQGTVDVRMFPDVEPAQALNSKLNQLDDWRKEKENWWE